VTEFSQEREQKGLYSVRLKHRVRVGLGPLWYPGAGWESPSPVRTTQSRLITSR